MRCNKNCKNCNSEFKDTTGNRKFCSSSCSATFNNKYGNRNKSVITNCEYCLQEFKTSRKTARFCSQKCSAKHKSLVNYEEVMAGRETKSSYNPVTAKKFILIEQDNKCAICSILNEWQGKILVFIIDHINGDSTYNKRNNLRLVCPNCDSQLPTFKSKNKNGGRHYRNIRRLEGKSY